MRVYLFLLPFIFGTANAQVFIDNQTNFGQRGSAGEYQTINLSVTLKPCYFSEEDEKLLESNTDTQREFEIWPSIDKANYNWGIGMPLHFQNGELVSKNPRCAPYKRLDETQVYATIVAIISYDDKAQADARNIQVKGTLKLVSGAFHYGPVTGSGLKTPADHFSQSIVFRDDTRRASRIYSVALDSKKTDPLTVGDLKSAVGPFLKVFYP